MSFYKNILCSLLLVLLFFSGTAQEEWQLELFIPAKSNNFYADHLGNVYLQQQQELVKYNQKGEEKNRFSNKLLGQVTSIDVTNPMKIVLFYQDLTQLLFLDNTLSSQGEPIALEKLNFEQTQKVCYSYNNGLWLYDLNTYELIRLDENLEVTHRTGNINQITGREVFPNFMVERNNRLYVNDPVLGILVFDVFGTYLKTIPIKNLERFRVSGDVIYYVKLRNAEGSKTQKLWAYNTKTLVEREILLPEQNFLHAEVEKQKLYLLTAKELKIYSLKK